MSPKRIFTLALFMLILGISLFQSHSALAEETAPAAVPFKLDVGEQPILSSSWFIPEINDEVLLVYSLGITDTLLTSMQDSAAQGLVPAVVFETRGTIEVTGSGSGGYRADVFVAIRHTDGSRSLLHESTDIIDYKQGGENPASSVEKTEKIAVPLDDWLDRLQPGDFLLVGANVQFRASSGSESGDLVTLSWEIIQGGSPFPVLQYGSYWDWFME